MERVNHIPVKANMSVDELVQAMLKTGVLGAGRLGRAAEIVRRMFKDSNYFTFLAMSGPMVPGGLRALICHLIDVGHIDAIVTSGANIVHDLLEAYGGAHYRVPIEKNDQELRAAGMGRIADLFV